MSSTPGNTSDHTRPPRVVFCPHETSNPYLVSLGAAMERLGWKAAGAPLTTLLLLRSRETRRADVVHLHWPDAYVLSRGLLKSLAKSLCFLAQLWLCRWSGKRIVWTCHNLNSHEGQFLRLQGWVARRLLGVCHVALAHSPACCDSVARRHGERFRHKLRAVPHANYIEDYPNTATREAARRRFGIDDGAFVFLFLGSVRGYKGVEDLIADFERLGDAGARLIIAGKAIDQEIDRRVSGLAAATPGVEYHGGFVPPDEIQHYMAAADVVVLPYRKILTSGTLILAASFAKVAIVPDAPTLLDTVAEDGVVPFDRNDGGALLAALESAIAQRDRLAERGEASQAFVRSWGWSEMASATIDAYGVAARRGPRRSR